MLKEFASPLTLELRPSAIFNYFLIVIHSLAAFAIAYTPIAWFLQLLFFVLLALHFSFQKRVHNHRYKLVWLNDNNWCLYGNDDEYEAACLTPMSFLSSWLVILAFKTEGARRVSVLVACDSLDSETFRRLKVRLTVLKPKLLQKLSAD